MSILLLQKTEKTSAEGYVRRMQSGSSQSIIYVAFPGRCFDSAAPLLAVFSLPRDACEVHAAGSQLLAETCSWGTWFPCLLIVRCLGLEIKSWQLGWAA